MVIEQPAFWLRWLYPTALWRMDPGQKAVYLTFDDGPVPEATPFVLDTLKAFGAKATFFMVGENAMRHHDIYNRVVEEGHRIGNHTFNHMGGVKHSIFEYGDNIDKADALLHTDLFRPPHGWMKPLQYAWIARKYKIVMWDLVTRDYSKWMTAQGVFNNVKRYTRNGSIITFHDSERSIGKLHQALPLSLAWLRDNGYAFKTFQ